MIKKKLINSICFWDRIETLEVSEEANAFCLKMDGYAFFGDFREKDNVDYLTVHTTRYATEEQAKDWTELFSDICYRMTKQGKKVKFNYLIHC